MGGWLLGLGLALLNALERQPPRPAPEDPGPELTVDELEQLLEAARTKAGGRGCAKWLAGESDKAYAKLDSGGKVANVTIGPGGTFFLNDTALAVRFTNDDAASHVVRSGFGEISLAPGAQGTLYTNAKGYRVS